MNQLVRMTTGRMLGAAAVSSVYFGLLFAAVVAGEGAIEAARFYHSTDLHTVVVGALPAMWVLPFAVPIAGVASLALGFPIGLLARRLIGRTPSVVHMIIAAFVVGAIACTVVTASVALASSAALAGATGEVRPTLAESLASFWWWVLIAAVSSVLGAATVFRRGSALAAHAGRAQ